MARGRELHRLQAYASLTSVPISIELCQLVLKDITKIEFILFISDGLTHFILFKIDTYEKFKISMLPPISVNQ